MSIGIVYQNMIHQVCLKILISVYRPMTSHFIRTELLKKYELRKKVDNKFFITIKMLFLLKENFYFVKLLL